MSQTATAARLRPSEVATWIRDRIREGTFAPGQRLVEADVVAATGAGRAKVREAFRRLEMEGLIEIVEFKGACVRQLSLDQVQQIYRARMALEGLAANEFARKDVPDLKRRLEELQQDMDKIDGTGDHDLYAKLNSAWHDLIIEGSGNSYVRQFLSQLHVPIYRLLFSTFYNSARVQNANADHRLITRAIVEGRAEDAESAMKQHIEHGLNALSDLQSDFFS